MICAQQLKNITFTCLSLYTNGFNIYQHIILSKFYDGVEDLFTFTKENIISEMKKC